MSIEANIKNMHIGNKNVKEIYNGNNLIFSKRIYLYNNGNENIQLTRGWSEIPLKYQSISFLTQNCSLNKNLNNIEIIINRLNSENPYGIAVSTNNKINLTKYKKLFINIEKLKYDESSDDQIVFLATVQDSNAGNYYYSPDITLIEGYTKDFNNIVKVINLENIIGQNYIWFSLYQPSGGLHTVKSSIKINKIYLE